MLTNVTELYVDTVTNDIDTFLKEEITNEHTRRGYEFDIKYFFQYMRDKSLNELTTADLWFEYKDILRYRSHLKNKYTKSATIERKIASVSKLYRYFAKNNYKINPHAFELGREDADDTNGADPLSVPEAIEMAEMAKELRNGEEKSLIIELAYMTSFRISAILDLTWDKFNYAGNDLWEIRINHKRKKDKKPIFDETYQRLKALKKSDTDKVFSVSYTTIYETIKMLAKKMGIEDERKITPHSLKKTMINWTLDQLKDVLLAAKQGNHTLDVMQRHYADKRTDYSKYPIVMMRNGNDISPLEELDKEELIRLIQKASYGTQNELLSLLKQEG